MTADALLNGLTSQQHAAASLMFELQQTIIDGLEQLEREADSDARFQTDAWQRGGGGGGVTRTLVGERLLEKAGVNVSVVHGELDARFADAPGSAMPGEGTSFFATGVSLVLHPVTPHVPTVHANFRMISRGTATWFGGGADLTPYYYDADDERSFHAAWRAVCERHAPLANYEEFARWCDRYFYLPHRGESRGIGGIFFDHLRVDQDEAAFAAGLAFLRDAGRAFVDAYAPIVRRHRNTPVTEAQREWHELRRGRYVEFNLLYDRGTTFGLKTGGRTESILMSLPPRVRYAYNHEPAQGSAEAALLQRVRRPLETQ